MPRISTASCSANCRPMHDLSPVPNGLYRVPGRALTRSGAKRSGSNSSGLGPQRGSRCSAADHDDRPVALAHRVLAGQQGVFAGGPVVAGHGRLQPQRLVEHPAHIAQLGDLLELRALLLAPHLVHFCSGAGEHLGVTRQEVQREGQCARGGFVTGDEEVDHLVADVGRVEVRRQHDLEQVVVVARPFSTARGDDLVGDAVHIRGVATNLALVVVGDEPGQEGAPENAEPVGTAQALDHVLDERVHGFGPEAAEGVAGRAPTDGLQRHAGGVGRHIDGVRSGPSVPVRGQLCGHVEHHRVVAAHGGLREGRHQELVGLVPVRLVVVGGEQPVATQEAQRLQVATDVLAEPPFVVEVGDQVGAGHDDVAGTHERELINRPEVFGVIDRRLGRSVAVEGEDVAQQRNPPPRMGNAGVLDRLRLEHRHFSSLQSCYTCVK